MATAATLIKRNSCPGGETHVYLSLSGTYTTGGDVLDFRPYSGSTKGPYIILGNSESGNSVAYIPSTGKLLILTPAGVELASSAAIPAGMRVLAIFPKFG